MNKTLSKILFTVKYSIICIKARAKHEMVLVYEMNDGTREVHVTKARTQTFTLYPTSTQHEMQEVKQ